MTTALSVARARRPIPPATAVRVFFRDGWLCRWCHRPVVFAPAFRLLEAFVTSSGYERSIAYFHPSWRRDEAPLLDHLGAVVDHAEAFARGGEHGDHNFVTACNKCNTRKNDKTAADYALRKPGKPVKGKYGEPRHWDGFASLFLVLADQGVRLTSRERVWAVALREHLQK